MKILIKLAFLLVLSTTGIIAWGQGRSAVTEVQGSDLKRAAISASASAGPSSARDLSAGPTTAASAACCLKQCGGGGTCGNNCTIADNLSQCGAVNFKFECPSGKGMTCLGTTCSCQ